MAAFVCGEYNHHYHPHSTFLFLLTPAPPPLPECSASFNDLYGSGTLYILLPIYINLIAMQVIFFHLECINQFSIDFNGKERSRLHPDQVASWAMEWLKEVSQGATVYDSLIQYFTFVIFLYYPLPAI